MRERVIFMFSGQGSQYFQMGRELFEHNAVFRSQVQRLDRIGVQLLGTSLVDYLYDRSRHKWEPFEAILFSNAALFTIQYALAQAVVADGVVPDILLGSSLGTFVATAVGGCFSAEDGLRAVIHLARIVEERCPAGGMLAILAHPDLYRQDRFLQSHSELAGVNFDAHFVLAGSPANLQKIATLMQERNISCQAIAVPRAFHSRLIDAAEEPCREMFRSLPRRRSCVPITCTAQVALLEAISEHSLWRAVRDPMRLRDTIELLERTGDANLYLDVGPSGTLAAFVKYHLTGAARSRATAVLTPFGRDVHSYRHAMSHVRAAD